MGELSSLQITEDRSIFSFHDFRAFMKESAGKKRGGLRALALGLGISQAFLSSVLNNKKKLPEKYIDPIGELIGLDETERRYLRLLVILSDHDAIDERKKAFAQIRKMRRYRTSNAKELEAYRYLNDWYFVAIREMVALKDFSDDPVWIQSRLRQKVSIKKIREAFDFLLENHFIERSKTGKYSISSRPLMCESGVFKLAMHQFHSSMLEVQKNSIYDTSSDERNLSSSTVSIHPKQYPEMVNILLDAQKKILDLASKNKNQKEKVYQVNIGSFPLTLEGGSEE